MRNLSVNACRHHTVMATNCPRTLGMQERLPFIKFSPF